MRPTELRGEAIGAVADAGGNIYVVVRKQNGTVGTYVRNDDIGLIPQPG